MLTTSIIRGYTSLTVYDHSLSLSKPLQRIDLRSVSARDLADLSFFADRSTVTVYAARDPLRHLPRAEQGSLKHGSCIKLTSSQLRAIREALVGRPHRAVSEVSRANLCPQFTRYNRPNKPRKYAPEMVRKALDLRASGLSWQKLGQALGANAMGLRSACLKYSA